MDLHRFCHSQALRTSAEPVSWSVQAPASLAPPPVRRLASRCTRYEHREVTGSTVWPRKAGGESNDPTQCGSGRKALSVLRNTPNLKHKFQYNSVHGKSVSVASQELQATARPNPSIEGMPKRLRLLCTPHVKR